jgi:hypothetical protein
MNAINSLRKLINALSSEERKVIESFLTAFHTRGSNNQTLLHKLFEVICLEIKNNQILSDENLELTIYSKSAGVAFHRLIFRLIDKIHEGLILSVNIDRTGAYSDKSKVQYKIRKDISVAQILISRGLEEQAANILDECTKQALKYEHFEDSLSAIRIRMQIVAINSKPQLAEELSSKYDMAIRSAMAVKKAERYYSKLISEVEYKLMSSEDLELISVRINDLQKELSLTGSANVAYYQTILETHYFQQIKIYDKASETLLRQIEIVEQHPALYNPSRLSLSLLNFAWNELYLHRFESCNNYLEKASQIIKKQGFNHSQILLASFYAHFFSGKYEKAFSIIVELDKKDTGVNAEFRIGKRTYLKACTLFMLKQYKQVSQLLLPSNSAEKDKEGWNLLFRILIIQNDIEMEQIEPAFQAIEALRKQIDKYKKANVKIERINCIYDMLRGLANSRFEFNDAFKKKQDVFNKLNKLPASQWTMFNCELVIFEQWFAAKMNKTELKLTLPKSVSIIPQKVSSD